MLKEILLTSFLHSGNIEQLAMALMDISMTELFGLFKRDKSPAKPPLFRNKSASFDLLVILATIANVFFNVNSEELCNF